MSSTEPPSRVPPKNQTSDSKAVNDELTSKGKVEKVRGVDADETRKRRFLKYYKDQVDGEDDEVEPRLSPFDLASGKSSVKSGLPDVDQTAIPGPGNAPPPSVTAQPKQVGNDEATEEALPHSEHFWGDVDFPPDHPLPPNSFKEMQSSSGSHKHGEIESNKTKKKGKDEERRGHAAMPHQQDGREILPSHHKNEKKGGERKGSSYEGIQPEKKEEATPPRGRFEDIHKREDSSSKMRSKELEKEELSPFGLPGKSKVNRPSEKELKPFFEETSSEKAKEVKARAFEKEEERYLGKTKGLEKEKKKERDEAYIPQDPGMIRREEQERRGGNKKDKDHKVMEIRSPSLPALPLDIQPIANAAANQAMSYLHPSTISLFYQMVGTMVLMTNRTGVNRTEIVLNNPSYAESKFFGATIRIEKYATAPDSFNITLTGSNTAVAAFKENMPSLMTAFQNGNFTFRVGRIDAVYSTERPVFRRKERGEGNDEADGGDLGERRK